MKPKFSAKLDLQFMPLSLACKQMRVNTKEAGQDLVIAITRNKGFTSPMRSLGE